MKLSEICEILGFEAPSEIEISRLNSLKNAGKSELSYCDGIKNERALKESRASAILVSEELREFVPAGTVAIVCENPHLSFAILSKFFAKDLIRKKAPNFIDKTAQIMENVHVGSNSHIGENCVIMSGVFIGDDVKIGAGTIIHPNAVIYNDTIIGQNCTILAGAVIGSDGFGYAHRKDGSHVKIYHNGNVILEDEVDVGANTTIDRGVFEPTVVKKGTKIDNLVQIGHNCDLGEHCLIVSQTGLAGSTVLGRNVVMGGQSGTAGHVSVGDFTQIAARGGVSKNLPAGKVFAGQPILELKDWLKLNAKIAKFFKDK